MEKTFAANDPSLHDYAEKTFYPEDEILKQIVARTKAANIPLIQVGAMDGLHLEVLVRAMGAKKIVEFGTLGGYSATCMARGLAPGGKIFSLEISEENAGVARENLRLAKVDDKVEILIGPAIESCQKIENEGPFDLIFIDADKGNYSRYFDWAAKNLRVGGTILADNTFAWGLIGRDEITAEQKPSVAALRAFNQKAAQHPEFRSTILPTGEGLTMSVKIR